MALPKVDFPFPSFFNVVCLPPQTLKRRQKQEGDWFPCKLRILQLPLKENRIFIENLSLNSFCLLSYLLLTATTERRRKTFLDKNRKLKHTIRTENWVFQGMYSWKIKIQKADRMEKFLWTCFKNFFARLSGLCHVYRMRHKKTTRKKFLSDFNPFWQRSCAALASLLFKCLSISKSDSSLDNVCSVEIITKAFDFFSLRFYSIRLSVIRKSSSRRFPAFSISCSVSGA